MPIAQIMLFGFAITNEINNVNIAILDKSKDTETEIIINKISASSISISNRRLVLSLK
jgi:ABC-2 type transport system permease protein